MMHLTKILNRRGRGPGLLLALAALLLSTAAQADATRALQSVDFVALSGDRVLLTLTLSGPAPDPVVFTIEKPARLSMDLPDTRISVPERYRKIGIGKVQAVGMAEAKGRTRLVVEMSELLPHTVNVDGNKIFLQLGGGDAAAGNAATGSSASAFVGVPAVAARSSAGQITGIDFRRGEKGEGRVIVTLSDDHAPVDVREEGGKVIARFKNTSVPENLLKRLDVLDFATPVKFVDTRRDGINTEIVVTPIEKADYEQVAYQSGNQFTVELQPLTQEKIDERKKQQPEYTGQRISLSFQSVDVRSLLQIIADVAGVNMVISDSVTGNIALRLQNVPWDQALDVILRSKGLSMRRQGNVMQVAPTAEMAARDKEEMEAEKQKVELAPLVSEIIQINYAKAADILALLIGRPKGVPLGAGGAQHSVSLLSDRGRVTVDARTNTLIVLETRDKLAEIRALIAKLDIPVRQVLIESRIVNASDDFSRQVGTQFGVTSAAGLGSSGLITTSGTTTGTSTVINNFLGSGGKFPVTPPSSPDFNVNLPTTAPAGSFALGILSGNYLVNLELSAMQAEGQGEIVSTPRVITANGKEATIKSGQQIPYQSNSGTTGTTTLFVEADLILTVTPNITPDNRILMDLNVHNDSLGNNVLTGAGSAPAINTQAVTTQVLVKTGDTVVLGGIYQNNTQKNVTKVPLLGDLPLLGFLFRTDSTSITKTELLIFITPKILQDGLHVNN